MSQQRYGFVFHRQKNFRVFVIGRQNKSNAQDLLEVFNQFGPWPVLIKNFDYDEFDITTLLGLLGRQFGNEFFVQLQVNPDVKDEKIYKLTVNFYFQSKRISIVACKHVNIYVYKRKHRASIYERVYKREYVSVNM